MFTRRDRILAPGGEASSGLVISLDSNSLESEIVAQGASAPGAAPCPYIGLADDPASCYAFPQPYNYCHRFEPPCFIYPQYQVEVCYAENQAECPLLGENWKDFNWKRFSPDRPKNAISKLKEYLALGLWAIAGIGLLLFLCWILFGGFGQVFALIASAAITPAPDLPPLFVAQAAEGKPTSGSTPAPAPTLESTPVLEIGSGLSYVIYTVNPGDTLDTLALKFSTSEEVLAQTNAAVRVMLERESLLAKANVKVSPGQLASGTILVIIPEVIDPQGLPGLRPVYLDKDILLTDFAGEQGVTDEQIRTYNLLGNAEWIQAGRWIIVPEGQ